MENPFTNEQIAALSAEIDEQLRELSAAYTSGTLRSGEGEAGLPEKQCKAIEQASGEKAKTFLQKFRKAARQDLCQEGGVLYAQWKKWGDLSNEKVLKSFGAALVALGLSGTALQIAAVALGVIVLHIGVKAFCMEE
jgi:hypothetical protein